MKVSLIVAYGNNKELGYENKLLWHIPEDLQNFKNITNGKALFMGRNTYDSIFNYLKKPLPGRFSFVLTNNKLDNFSNVLKVESFDEAIVIAKEKGFDEIIIIGGASIYKKYFHMANKLYISEIDFDGKADCFFENEIDNSWNQIENINYDNKNGISWKFKIFEK